MANATVCSTMKNIHWLLHNIFCAILHVFFGGNTECEVNIMSSYGHTTSQKVTLPFLHTFYKWIKNEKVCIINERTAYVIEFS